MDKTTADSIIQRAPRAALLAALLQQESESHSDSMRSTNPRAIQGAIARVHAIARARAAIAAGRIMPDSGAMIIALNEACRILGIPAPERSTAAVDYAQELVAIGVAIAERESLA